MSRFDENYARTPDKFIFTLLANTTTANTLGNYDMNVDGGVSPKEYFYQCDNTAGCYLTSLNLHMLDGSINPSDFGGIAGGINNGCGITFKDTNGSTLLDVSGFHKLQTNADLIALSGHKSTIFTSGGDDLLSASWDIFLDNTNLLLKLNQRISVTINDTLTALSHFQMGVHGVNL